MDRLYKLFDKKQAGCSKQPLSDHNERMFSAEIWYFVKPVPLATVLTTFTTHSLSPRELFLWVPGLYYSQTNTFLPHHMIAKWFVLTPRSPVYNLLLLGADYMHTWISCINGLTHTQIISINYTHLLSSCHPCSCIYLEENWKTQLLHPHHACHHAVIISQSIAMYLHAYMTSSCI